MQLLLVTSPPPIPSKQEACIRAIFFSNNHIVIKTIMVSLSFFQLQEITHSVHSGDRLYILESRIVGCPEEQCERMYCFVRNSSFCPAHAFEVLTSTSFYRQFIICTFYLSKFHTKLNFLFKYHILQFYLQY